MSKHVTEPALAVDVRELLQQPGAHKHVVLRAVLPGLATPVASVPPEEPVTVDVELESVVEGLLVTGKVRATVRLRCVRCLRDVEHELAVDVRELFTGAGSRSASLGAGEEEDEGYTMPANDRLPLDTMARDALVLGFPSFPLCRPDCAGLCPECGADRNATDCGHGASGATDPRWAALAGLRQALEEEDVARPKA
jgi:uncharacterized protein